MEKELFAILEKFYKKLHDNVIREKKSLEHNSVLFTLIGVSSNTASKLLNDSSIAALAFPKNDLIALEKTGYIHVSETQPDYYILTALGIWHVEKHQKDLSEESIIKYFQYKYFTFFKGKKELKDTEKIILLSMIGVRNLSINSLMDINKKSVQDYWLNIFRESYNFLLSHNFIKKEEISFEKQGNEHPVSYAMRRADSLPKKTNHIYCKTGNKQYYLKLVESNQLSKSKLKYLFKLIFGKIDEFSLIDDIKEFCNNIAYERSKFVMDNFNFVESKCDEIIKSALKDLYLD